MIPPTDESLVQAWLSKNRPTICPPAYVAPVTGATPFSETLIKTEEKDSRKTQKSYRSGAKNGGKSHMESARLRREAMVKECVEVYHNAPTHETIVALAKKNCIAYETMRRYLREAHVKVALAPSMLPAKAGPLDIAIADFYKLGWSRDQVGTAFRVSHQRVAKALDRTGTVKREQRGARTDKFKLMAPDMSHITDSAGHTKVTMRPTPSDFS